MPMDPKKVVRVLTEHFENITEEKFLNTLRKSSPHLFIEDPEERERVFAERYSGPYYGPRLLGEDLLPIAYGTSEAIDLSTPKPIDDRVAELPNGKLGNNGHSTNAQAKLDVEIDEDWLKENATPELLQKIYDYLPDAEKKKATEVLLESITSLAPKAIE
jgi:hypothetical protein